MEAFILVPISVHAEAASVWLNGTGYIVKKEGAGPSYNITYVSFRFNTISADGTILHTVTGNKDIFTIELVKGRLVMQINLGGGNTRLKVTIQFIPQISRNHQRNL